MACAFCMFTFDRLPVGSNFERYLPRDKLSETIFFLCSKANAIGALNAELTRCWQVAKIRRRIFLHLINIFVCLKSSKYLNNTKYGHVNISWLLTTWFTFTRYESIFRATKQVILCCSARSRLKHFFASRF